MTSNWLKDFERTLDDSLTTYIIITESFLSLHTQTLSSILIKKQNSSS